MFFPILEAGKSKTKVFTIFAPGESCLPGLLMTAFFLCAHMEDRVLISLHLLVRALIPSWGAHCHDLI
jgi:hypothetical protein